MSAKLLMGLSEENPKLEKQIGCMTGIFQVFEGHHFITGRRLIGHNQKRLSSGESRSSGNTSYNEIHNQGSPQIVLEYNRNKSSKENRRVLVDSSPSLSSSPSSSFSSLECKKPAKPKISDIDTKHTRNDFRDVVKDSINAETRFLSVRTSAKDDEKKNNVFKHRDSPRPVMSVDLNDALRVLVRLKEGPNACEAPRFSCDGREITRSKSSTKLRELPRFSLDSREISLRSSNLDTQHRDRGSPNQGIPSVIAKLMGLDTMPTSASQEPMELIKCNSQGSTDLFPVESERDRMINSVKSSVGASDTQKLKNAGPGSNHFPKQTESVYSQIQRRAQELEFSPSNKDLRALKHILDTMQAKGILDRQKSDCQQLKVTSQKNQNMMSADAQNPQISIPRAFESPIVIMKPAKSIKRPEDLEGPPGLRKIRTSDSPSRRKAKEQTPKASTRDPINDKRTEENKSQRSRTPLMQRSPRPQQPARERSGSPAKTMSPSSPRAQQRKLEAEKKPQTSTRKHKANRKPLEPVLSNGSPGVKRSQAHMNNARDKGDDVHISLAIEIDEEATGNDHLRIMSYSSHQEDNNKIQNEDSSSTDSAIISMEQPSPISVLDQAAFYQDDLPLSPVKKISCSIEADEHIQTSPEECKIKMSLVHTAPSKLSTEIHLQKLNIIKNLVQKLKQLGSSDDVDVPESDHDPLSQLLLSAGLLSNESTLEAKSNAERLHQELMFDVVKEILARNLESMSKHGPRLNVFPRPKKLGRQNLLTELCSEIKQVLAEKPLSANLEDDDLAFREDLLRRSDWWEDFGIELPGLVLEIERSIFKDLIDEIVTSEDCHRLQAQTDKRKRQLFH